MKVRELIHALQMHDPDMDVVVPAEPGAGSDFSRVGAVEADVFWLDPSEHGNLQLAELRDAGAFTAVRLRAKRRG